MCLILFAHDLHPDYLLVLAANRDEFHARPTAAAHRWPEGPRILAGKDLRAGGTWLGVTDSGRWAVVSNFRDAAELAPGSRSRGRLVVDFLESSTSPFSFFRSIMPHLDDFGGFNFVAGQDGEVGWVSNRARRNREELFLRLEPGIYGLSNHLLDTPWPKVVRGKRELSAVLAAGPPPSRDALLEILLDRAYAADHELPDTGVGVDLERALSASFIATPDYGTRASTALLIARGGEIAFAERRFDAEGRIAGEAWYEI